MSGVLDKTLLLALATKVVYLGDPVHKRNPGDFALTPPAAPRSNHTLCDGTKIFERALAMKLLKKGVELGLISDQFRGGLPQNVWAVSPNGFALEAALENADAGTYHGYPMSFGDPLATEVLKRWKDGGGND